MGAKRALQTHKKGSPRYKRGLVGKNMSYTATILFTACGVGGDNELTEALGKVFNVKTTNRTLYFNVSNTDGPRLCRMNQFLTHSAHFSISHSGWRRLNRDGSITFSNLDIQIRSSGKSPLAIYFRLPYDK